MVFIYFLNILLQKQEIHKYFNFAGDVVDKWAEDKNKSAIIWVNDQGSEIRRSFHDIKTKSAQEN